MAAVTTRRAWPRVAALAVMGTMGAIYAVASVGVQIARVLAWRRAARCR